MKKTIHSMIYMLIISAVLLLTGCDMINLFNLGTDDFDYGDTFAVKLEETLYENHSVSVTFEECELADNTVREDSLLYHSRTQFALSILGRDTSLVFEAGSSYFSRDLFGMEPGYIFIFRVDSLKQETGHFTAYCVLDRVDEQSMVDKPNIYLYPRDTTILSVDLNFPKGGSVVKSDPAYPYAWQDISVAPDGTINGKYKFLFYEAEVDARWQYRRGWVIKQKELPQFFRNTLRVYGLNQQEIEDFMDYWLERLSGFPVYTVYPQLACNIDQLIELNVSQEPESILRLYYIFKKGKTPFWKLGTPKMTHFQRRGFSVVEWGGSLLK